ncbi:hypothetical protein Kpol_1033p7 [Vanderwaltozyma polyspora DSM 70294]|uniref:Inositol-1-monophosphatase n=1 Tax=Vanderwaltozyma polyspora (strain ATCC 22028 / DSM 70294 / BCRC 21397 / CBS 2163 / NBRC 10782 / NRRL Y-8283 / UCD 57-17) TaxID=436907 RepID=A7TJ05_VANPO|nr:uncharacterized protein Kpol_1033p7 [Vanderwaltozyma polyspora DSM 70294]EDO17704.1 hypothetical protein Kpol_1033p7 [Vanderwaltozyma polyspora DSM 70294]
MALSKQELKSIENALINLVKEEVGPLIKVQSGTKFESYEDKANSVDLVTQVDQKVESIVKNYLLEKYPNFKFIGEESYVKGVTKITNEPTFIVDPIDGTTNFIHGFPYSCISLGLSENQKPVVGVVFNPHLNQLFHGSKGNGAFLNGTPIEVAKRPLVLQKALVGFESGSERDDSGNFDIKAKTCKNLLSQDGALIHGVRSLGSAAMNICYVATGMMDCYWEGGPWCWDVCAGWCILNETGGLIVNGNPNNWDVSLNGRCYFAIRGGSNEKEQHEFIKSFWSHVAGDLKYEYKD